MSTERTIDATKVTPSATAEGDAFVMTSAGGSLKKCDIDAITARLKELGVVSGRNIVKDSHPDKETTEYTLALLEYTEELAVGDIITITLFGELGSQKEYLQAIHNGGDGSRGATRLSKISDGIYRGTMIVHRTDGDGTLHLYAVPNTVASATKVRCVMVERGKTGSLMWTPAPEDVADLLANRWGGVKSTFPIRYTSRPQSAEKGVRHERQNNGTDRSIPARMDGRCDDRHFQLQRHGYMSDSRLIHRDKQYGEYTRRYIQVWPVNRFQSRNELSSGVSDVYSRQCPSDSYPHGLGRKCKGLAQDSSRNHIARRKEVVAA
ncbi:hypothetical protein [Bacteroides acidifaciens]|jgi:hypothetical protein|uniref:hypothetical protein n=2 Tax=Bacteroidales TaxID=171549 RepID=UPI0025B2FF8F|nr:hypothetical protein [Bacteroides acidifaciens]